MSKILYCPSCKTEDLNFEISSSEFEKMQTSTYIGDRIVPYMICPHCKYILAGTRDARCSQEENEIELLFLKEYTNKDGGFIKGEIYEELINKAQRKISYKIEECEKELLRLKNVKSDLD